MTNPAQTTVGRYGLAIVAVAVALLISLALAEPLSATPSIFVFAAVMLTAWYAGLGPAIVAALLASIALDYFLIEPRFTFEPSVESFLRAALFFAVAVGAAAIGDVRRRADERAREARELLTVTLASIGDAVLATDSAGTVTFMNDVAAGLTGWDQREAIGHPLDEIFRIINEHTREPAPSPFTEVIASGRIVGLANHTLLLSRDGREIPIEDSGAPIRDDAGSIIGVVLVFRDGTERRRNELERERLLDAERLARAEAELSQQRFEYLSMASAVLSSSLDFETTLDSAVRMAVPRLADWAAIDLVVDGAIKRLAVAHIDPAKVEWAWELHERFPQHPDAPSGVPAVIRTGRSEFVPEVTQELINATVADPELLAIIEQINFTSSMVVPIRVRERIVGAITFVTAESRRRLDESDLALAEDLARRASAALENAELYLDLAHQRRSLEVTLASIGDAVISTDGDGSIVFMNAVAERLTGWTIAEAAGQPLEEIFHVLRESSGEAVESPVARVLRENTIVELGNGMILVDRNGERRPIDDSAAPIRNEDGSIGGVVMTFRDVSDRRSAEREIRAQRDQLNAILRGVSDGITAMSPDGRIVFANDAAARTSGFSTVDEMLGASMDDIAARFELFDEHDAPLPLSSLPSRRALAGEASGLTLQFRYRDGGERRWSSVHGTPVFDDQGRVQFAISIFHDITAAMRAERTLRIRAAQQTAVATLGQSALAGASIAGLMDEAVSIVARALDVELVKILELEPDGRHLVVRSGVGWRDGVVGHRHVETGEATQAGYTLARQRPVVTDDLALEKRFVGAPLLREHDVVSGMTVTIGSGSQPYGILGVHSRERREFSDDDAHFLEAVANVIASSIGRRMVEERLEQQREWFRVTLASIGDAVIATDTEGAITFMNPVAVALTGWTMDEAAGRPLDEVFTIVNETTRETAPNPAHAALAEGLVVGLANHTVLIARDGTEVPIDDSAAPIRGSGGSIHGVVLVFHDVSERRRTEERLKLSESRFRLLVEQSPLSIQVFTPDGFCVQANRAWEDLWQASREHLAGYNILEDPQLEARGMLAPIRAAFNGEPGATAPIRYDPHEIGKAGRPRWVRSVIYPVIDESGATTEVVLVLEDVTVRVVAEQRLEIQFAISRLLASSDSIEAAAAVVLEAVGSHLGSTFGALWLVDRESGVLRAADVWLAPGTRAEEFASETRAIALEPGEGLPGRIWSERTALYVAELPSAPEYPRQTVAHGLGLGSGYGFPILLGGEVHGVFEFFAAGTAEPREEIVETMDAVGRQIAQFVERKRAEMALRESEERYRTVAETASDAILIVDDESRIIFANRAVEAVFGFRSDELAGADLRQLMPDYRRTLGERNTRPLDGAPGRAAVWSGVELPGRHRSGQTIPLEISSGEFVRDGRHYATAIVRDITDRKSAERDLKHAKEQAEAASAAKDQFLAVLSHELRTPLTPVLTLVQFLESTTEPPEDIRSIFTMIRRNIELEARLIDDLLDLTRITRGKLHLDIEMVDAHSLIRNVADICREDIALRNQTLDLELDARSHRIKADPARLQQVFWNLLQNAVKFTPEGGAITVRSCNPTDGELEVDVCDTGIGLEQEQLARVFNPFEQAEQSISRRFGGLGLGLSISRTIVEMHGGTIGVESDGLNRGATFSVRLATGDDAVEPSAAAAPDRGTDEQIPRRILLVDDHADTSSVMKLLLERRGYSVDTAWDVASGLEHARTREYDLLISDIGLPDGSGLDLMRAIRAFKPLPGIALSGFGMEDDIRRSHEAGFSEHLIKPVNFQALQDAIQRVLDKRSASV